MFGDWGSQFLQLFPELFLESPHFCLNSNDVFVTHGQTVVGGQLFDISVIEHGLN
jgi:hypothetical protein